MTDRGRIRFEFNPGEEFHRIARALREIDSTLPAQFRKDLREGAKLGAVAAKAAIRSSPDHPGGGGLLFTRRSRRAGVKNLKGRRLRNQIARGVGVRVSTGSRIQGNVIGRNAAQIRVVTRMPMGMEMLPRGYESHFWHWSFGGEPPIHEQFMDVPWFMEPIAAQRPLIRERIREAIDNALRRIAEAGRR